jgi:hypothetical protein
VLVAVHANKPSVEGLVGSPGDYPGARLFCSIRPGVWIDRSALGETIAVERASEATGRHSGRLDEINRPDRIANASARHERCA